jgi:hypothetical protein
MLHLRKNDAVGGKLLILLNPTGSAPVTLLSDCKNS